MSCEFCDLEHIVKRDDFDPHTDYLVGDWVFTKDDDLIHHSCGRISLWYDFDDEEWALLILVDDDKTTKGSLPATVQLHPKVCPMCGRKL